MEIRIIYLQSLQNSYLENISVINILRKIYRIFFRHSDYLGIWESPHGIVKFIVQWWVICFHVVDAWQSFKVLTDTLKVLKIYLNQ